MPPSKRKCATCRYFQSNQLSGNGWCTHPSRQTSSDVRILVRKDELACRNSWGSDLWVSADGEQPAAPPPPAQESTTQLPIAMQRRDDEVTSLVHRDAPTRPQPTHDVARDDIMVVEASLVPERRIVEDDAGNAAAHADQEHRARILARGGTHSAIQDARERMLARRGPQSASDLTPPVIDEPAEDAEDEAPAEPTSTAPTIANADAPERAATPDEAPIQPSPRRQYGEPGRVRRVPDIVAEPSSPASDDDDPYNSVPPIDPNIDLPLATAASRDARPQEADDEPDEAHEADTAGQVTVYDAVLERARAIRAATGRESLPPATPERIQAEDAAREEKRARRRITTVPAVAPAPTTLAATATAAATPAPEPVREPARPDPAVVPVSQATPVASRPRPSAPAPRPAASAAPAQQPTPRMGIAIAALKQETPQRAPRSRPQQAARELDATFVQGIDFHRAPVDAAALEPAPEPVVSRPAPLRPATRVPVEHDLPTDDQVLARTDSGDDLTGQEYVEDFQDDDGYEDLNQSIEEPLAANRRGPFGRFRNPWRKDREAIHERQVMASVRGALAGADEYWEEPFAEDDADELDAEPMPRQVPEPALQQPSAAFDDEAEADIAFDAPRAPERRPVAQPERPRRAPAPTPTPAQPRQGTPGRAHGLYRPVHEQVFREEQVDPAPDYERLPSPPRNDRFDRGNGATVLRVRADAVGEPFEDSWHSPEAEPIMPAPRRPARAERIDAFRPVDAPPAEPDAFPEFAEPELQMELVEPVLPVAPSPWSFAPLENLESTEGMDALRGRLFGESAAPRRPSAGRQPDRQRDHQPGDDVVLDVPTRPEVTSAVERSPRTPKDSPLRSANYRPQEMTAPARVTTANNVASAPRRDRPQPVRQAAAPQVEYREEPWAADTVISDPADFDIREVLTGARDMVDLAVTIAPDVPRACRTCRDFRPSENGERGFCANNWAFTHRQMVNADDLPCQSTIGCWWLPSDRIWMPEERAETNTHRVDAMLPAPRRQRSG